jgi:hypothetical protein
MNAKIASNDMFFSRNPPVTLSAIRSLLSRLEKNDATAKAPMIDFIHHRLHHRYIEPLLQIPEKYKSGFLMMATSCLLIETLQSFYEGLENTNRCSQKSFIKFFEREKDLFPKYAECFPKFADTKAKKENFYSNIRCSILHQAETTGGYSILRDKSPLFDENEKTINANKFVDVMICCINKYINNLHAEPIGSYPWNMAIKKVTHICDNFEN